MRIKTLADNPAGVTVLFSFPISRLASTKETPKQLSDGVVEIRDPEAEQTDKPECLPCRRISSQRAINGVPGHSPIYLIA